MLDGVMMETPWGKRWLAFLLTFLKEENNIGSSNGNFGVLLQLPVGREETWWLVSSSLVRFASASQPACTFLYILEINRLLLQGTWSKLLLNSVTTVANLAVFVLNSRSFNHKLKFDKNRCYSFVAFTPTGKAH